MSSSAPERAPSGRAALAAVLGAALLLAWADRARAQSDDAAAYPCQVQASERVELASPVIGVIEKILVDRGEKVVKGQVVATLRADVERAEYALAQARASSTALIHGKQAKLAFAERKLERNSGLVKSNLVTENDIDEMRTDRDVAAFDVTAAIEAQKIAEKEMERAKVALDIHTVRSPIDGVVTERKLAAGELVRDQPIVIIEKIDKLYVEVALPVALLGQVTRGTAGHIIFDAPGIAPRTAAVALADPVVESTSNTFGARFVIDNADNRIPAGVKCHVQFGES